MRSLCVEEIESSQYKSREAVAVGHPAHTDTRVVMVGFGWKSGRIPLWPAFKRSPLSKTQRLEF